MMRTERAAIGIAFGATLFGSLLLAATPALAQSQSSAMANGFNPATNGFQPMFKPDGTAGKQAPPAPSALPGARPGRGAAPADKSVADLPPNKALFDAINRGDISEARDAIDRGADIRAQNELGMTPLELSVDLSRNDITFMLLSLRGASAGAISPKAAAATNAPAPATTAAKTLKITERHAAPRPAAPAPREYAVSADPGHPDPQAGFLGFGH